jgi:O-antigen biosynthesis protein
MNDGNSAGLTRGHLPATVLRNLGPTAVGVVDLDRSIAPKAPDGGTFEDEQADWLLLVRLHDDPLAVVHVERDLNSVADEDPAAKIWRLAGSEIRRHVERHRCGEVPTCPGELLSDPPLPGGKCLSHEAPDILTSAAVVLSTIGEHTDQLERSLRSLLAQRRPNFEILVIDNQPGTGETRETVGRVAAGDSRVRYVPEWRRGLSVARNRGLSETDAELVAFTDDDILTDPGWLEWLLAPFVEPGVAVACGMILPLKLETEAQKRFEQYLGFSRGVRRRSYDLLTGRAAGLPLYPFLSDVYGSGASMAFRRADLIATGGFDTALGAGSPARAGEETDAFSTAILRGGRIVYEPRSLCWHEHDKESDAIRNQIFGYGAGVGALITKALTSDRRFYHAVASKSVLGLLGRQAPKPDLPGNGIPGAGTADRTEELLRARRKGIIRGPLFYVRGVIRSRRMGLRDVIHGK